MPGLLSRVQHRVDAGYRICHWVFGGKSRYLHEEPFLKRPELAFGRDVDPSCREYYEDGFTVLGEARYTALAQELLAKLREDFGEAIRLTEQGKRLKQFDDRRRFWNLNAESGVIRLTYDDLDHAAYPTVFGDSRLQEQRARNAACFNDLFEVYPSIRTLVEDPTLTRLAGYANDGDARPIVIQLERKTHTTGAGYNGIHFDTLRSTFKAYLYLTDVDEECGPVAFSKGSHHWAASPTMLYDIMARRKTLFAPEDLERYGIRPFERVCGKAGSLFCFCSNAIHSATNVQPGRERWSLHLYYYGRRLWSSDKKERAGERRA